MSGTPFKAERSFLDHFQPGSLPQQRYEVDSSSGGSIFIIFTVSMLTRTIRFRRSKMYLGSPDHVFGSFDDGAVLLGRDLIPLHNPLNGRFAIYHVFVSLIGDFEKRHKAVADDCGLVWLPTFLPKYHLCDPVALFRQKLRT
jgi:hypothetical protein